MRQDNDEKGESYLCGKCKRGISHIEDSLKDEQDYICGRCVAPFYRWHFRIRHSFNTSTFGSTVMGETTLRLRTQEHSLQSIRQMFLRLCLKCGQVAKQGYLMVDGAKICYNCHYSDNEFIQKFMLTCTGCNLPILIDSNHTDCKIQTVQPTLNDTAPNIMAKSMTPRDSNLQLKQNKSEYNKQQQLINIQSTVNETMEVSVFRHQLKIPSDKEPFSQCLRCRAFIPVSQLLSKQQEQKLSMQVIKELGDNVFCKRCFVAASKLTNKEFTQIMSHHALEPSLSDSRQYNYRNDYK